MNGLFRAFHFAIAFAFLQFAGTGCLTLPSSIPKESSEEPLFNHIVSHKGETLSAIALWYTGASDNWTTIQEFNPGLDPLKLQEGSVVHIPERLVFRRTPLKILTPRRSLNSNSPTIIPNPTVVSESEIAVKDTPLPSPVETNSQSAPVDEISPPPLPEENSPAATITSPPAIQSPEPQRIDELLRNLIDESK